jgi:hypothetical protein
MLLTDDLTRLKELDPYTYGNAFNWLRNTAWAMIRDDPEKYFLCPDSYPLRDALLQYCLQEAIAAREWTYTLMGRLLDERYLSRIDDVNENFYVEYGDSPAAASLAVYIAALEA